METSSTNQVRIAQTAIASGAPVGRKAYSSNQEEISSKRSDPVTSLSHGVGSSKEIVVFLVAAFRLFLAFISTLLVRT